MNYKVFKQLSIMLSTLGVPVSVASGVMLATNRLELFLVGMGITMGLAFIQSNIWYKSMEKMPKNS